MKSVRLIYNPCAGDKSFKTRLDQVVEEFQRQGLQVVPYKTLSAEDIEMGVKASLDEEYYAIAAAGGDGTINRVVNAMMKYNIKLPVGIFPWGTANDLAACLGIEKDIEQCCSIISGGKTKAVDIGMVNNMYFVNVAAGGLLTDVSQKIDITLKNTLGKLAYYLKGLEEFPTIKPIPAEFITSNNIINEKIYLFVALNGCSAGGFSMLARDAKIDDGKLDIIAVKACALVDIISLFVKLLKGEHLQDPNIIYIRTDKIKIDCPQNVETDIDGEWGPSFPLDIRVIPKAINFFVPY